MKLWVDDLRPPPDDTWTVARTSEEAVLHLLMRPWEVMSLDHDLGGEDTTREIIKWLCECEPECWPPEVLVHTSNPVGRTWLLGMIGRYKP
jgi:hypothetical protein